MVRTPQLAPLMSPLTRFMELCARHPSLRITGALVTGLLALRATDLRVTTLQRKPAPKDILWARSLTTGKSYAFSVNDRRRVIEVREARADSAVRFSFSDTTDLEEIDRLFLNL